MREVSRVRFSVQLTYFFVAHRRESWDPVPVLDNPHNFHYLSLEQCDFDHSFFKLYLNLMKSPDFHGRT